MARNGLQHVPSKLFCQHALNEKKNQWQQWRAAAQNCVNDGSSTCLPVYSRMWIWNNVPLNWTEVFLHYEKNDSLPVQSYSVWNSNHHRSSHVGSHMGNQMKIKEKEEEKMSTTFQHINTPICLWGCAFCRAHATRRTSTWHKCNAATCSFQSPKTVFPLVFLNGLPPGHKWQQLIVLVSLWWAEDLQCLNWTQIRGREKEKDALSDLTTLGPRMSVPGGG